MRPNSRNALGCLLVPAAFGVLTGIGLALGRTEWVEVLVISALGALLLLWAYEWGRARPRFRTLGARLPLPLDCAVVPRQDSTTEELKRLGHVLEDWWEREEAGAGGVLLALDHDALNDLLAGELPQPFGLRLLTSMRGARVRRGGGDPPARLTVQDVSAALVQARDEHPGVAHLIPRAELRAVFFGLADRSARALTRLADSLRRHVPADLVADVLIDGRSWTAE